MGPPFSLSIYSALFENYTNKNTNNTNNNTINTNNNHVPPSLDCDILFSNYIKCLLGKNTNCEKFHDQIEKGCYKND